jgi:hypothetical protein
MKNCLFVFVALLALSQVSAAQNLLKPGAAPMLSADVQEMIKAGLPEDLVVAKLRKENHAFDLSAREMVALKKDGVSDNIIKVMLDPAATIATPITIPGLPGNKASGATPEAGVSDAAVAANANNPDSPHDSGIYLHTAKNNQNIMVALERAATQGTKTGVVGAMFTYGLVKGKTKSIIPGARSSVRSGDDRPVFYFYFEDKAAALGKTGFGAQTVSNPSQFALVKLEVKKDHRETVIGTIGFGSASSGTESKSMIAFKADRIRPGVYKVVPTTNMEPGEYCFISASASGAAGAADIFDFSINQNQ